MTPHAEGRTADVVVGIPEATGSRRVSMHFQIRIRQGVEFTQRLMTTIERVVHEVLDSMGATFDAMIAARRIKRELLKGRALTGRRVDSARG